MGGILGTLKWGLSRDTVLNLGKLKIIVLAWMAVGVFITVYDFIVLKAKVGNHIEHIFLQELAFNLIAAFMGGVFGGAYLLFVVNRHFRSKPYYFGIAAISVAYVAIIISITFLLSVFQVALDPDVVPFTALGNERLLLYMLDFLHLKNLMVWGVIVALTQFIIQMNDKFGHGNLWDFIKGKYHSPKLEDRIFMMLDLKSSTVVAERLGNTRYYNLLRDFYSDITDPILRNRGQIYQYVGDEVVISWTVENGLVDCQCVKCYFDIREKIDELADHYRTEYGWVPEFKAGLHYGQVTAGEIGIIKRDITYSGDVLNTAARIQAQCNVHAVTILTSDALLDLMGARHGYRRRSIGEIQLRGKEETIGLSTLETA